MGRVTDNPKREHLLTWILLPLGVLAVAKIIVRPSNRYPPNWVNGTYSNPCCRSISFEDGTIKSGVQSTHYVLEADKRGLYAVPDMIVDVPEGARLTIGGDGKPYKLSFLYIEHRQNDEEWNVNDGHPNAHPKEVEIWDWSGSTVYTFSRVGE